LELKVEFPSFVVYLEYVIFERRKKKMIEVFVTVNYKDRNYQTNVIVKKETTWEKIKRLAEDQVQKQWNV
jgi:hypothetical protein